MGKKYKFYALVPKENPNIFLTISTNKKDLEEYLKRYLVINHFDHFKMWCTTHNFDTENSKYWKLYVDECIDTKEILNFKVEELRYDEPGMSSVLRMFSRCLPLGCSFEKPIEQTYFANTMQAMMESMKKSQQQTQPEVADNVNQ